MSTKKGDAGANAILDAALAVLRRDGVLALTQPRVAKAARIRQSHLTYYFPTRSDLVAAVAALVAQKLIAGFAAAFATDDASKLADRLARISTAEQTRTLLALVLAAEREKPVRRLFRALTKDVRRSMAENLSRLGIDSDAGTVAMLHALGVGLAVLDLARGEPAARQEIKTVTRRALARSKKAGRSLS